MPVRGDRYQSIERAMEALGELMRGKELGRDDLAEMGDVGDVTARRQFKALAKCPGVKEAQRGHRKVLVFDRETLTPPPDLLEVIAACFGASLCRVFQDSAYERKMRGALDYLLARARRAGLFRETDRKFLFVARGGEMAFPARSAELDDIIDAVLHSFEITLDYRNFQGDTQRLRIRPLSLAIYDHQLYVIGFGERGIHPYRFARIGGVTTHKSSTFSYPPLAEYDPDQVFRDSFGIFISDDFPVAEVVVRLSDYWAHYARSHRWHRSQRVTPNNDGSVMVRLRVKTCPELEMWILAFGERAEVIQPAELRERVAKRVAGMSAMYDETRQLTLLR